MSAATASTWSNAYPCWSERREDNRHSIHQEACEPHVDALVLVGDVEEAAVFGDRDALHARQGRELADEPCLQGAGVPVARERAAEVGRDGAR